MPVEFGPQSLLVSLIWESANFASGGGSTTLGFNMTSLAEPDLGALGTEISDVWQARFRALTDSDWTLERIRLEDATRSVEVPVVLAGTLSAVAPPPNTSVLFSYKAIGKGPRNRGRSYWPGLVAEGAIDERGVINPAAIPPLVTAMNNFFTDIEALDGVTSHAIAQSSYPGQASPPQDPWPSVVTRTVGALVATQRRRLRP